MPRSRSRTVTRKGGETVEVVYLMTSDAAADPATLASWVRSHWPVAAEDQGSWGSGWPAKKRLAASWWMSELSVSHCTARRLADRPARCRSPPGRGCLGPASGENRSLRCGLHQMNKHGHHADECVRNVKVGVTVLRSQPAGVAGASTAVVLGWYRRGRPEVIAMAGYFLRV